MNARHRWSEPSRPTELRTERTCIRCGLVRATRHDAGRNAIPWIEFYEVGTGLLVEGRGTPACEGAREARAG
jgi:hypothetical protein